MSAEHIIEKAQSRFPIGTNVDAYPLSGFAQHQLPPTGAPAGSSAEQATVAADGSLEFVALLPNTRYVAYAQVGGEHRYVHFVTEKWAQAEIETNGSAADHEIVAAVPGRRILTGGYLLSAGGAVTAQWKSGATAIGGPIKFSDTGGASHPSGAKPLATRRGQALNLNTAQAVVVGGHVLFTLEPGA